jgi:hypothetical protein
LQYLLDTSICVFFLRGQLQLDEVFLEKEIKNCFGWIDSFKTLLIRFDTLDKSWEIWYYLAFALILLKV